MTYPYCEHNTQIQSDEVEKIMYLNIDKYQKYNVE